MFSRVLQERTKVSFDIRKAENADVKLEAKIRAESDSGAYLNPKKLLTKES